MGREREGEEGGKVKTMTFWPFRKKLVEKSKMT
jgi:hypothetical protein